MSDANQNQNNSNPNTPREPEPPEPRYIKETFTVKQGSIKKNDK